MIAVIGFSYWFLFSKERGSNTREEAISRLQKFSSFTQEKNYRWGLGWLLQKSEALFGDFSPKGWLNAYLIILGLAFLYPVLFFLISYSFLGGENGVGGLEIFPDSFESYTTWRPWAFIALIIYGIAMYFLAKKEKIWLMLIFSIVAIGSVSGFVTGRGIVGGILSIVGIVSGGVNDVNTLLIIFFLIFPVVNSVFDLLSLQVSRGFLLQINKLYDKKPDENSDKKSQKKPESNSEQKSDSKWSVLLGYIVADFVVALATSLALALSLIFTIKLFNDFVIVPNAPSLVIDWRGDVAAAIEEPFGEGFMVTMMLFSPLLPSLIYIGMSLSVLFINLIKLLAKPLLKLLENFGALERQGKANNFKVVKVLGYFLVLTLLGILLSFVIPVVYFGVFNLYKEIGIGDIILSLISL